MMSRPSALSISLATYVVTLASLALSLTRSSMTAGTDAGTALLYGVGTALAVGVGTLMAVAVVAKVAERFRPSLPAEAVPLLKRKASLLWGVNLAVCAVSVTLAVLSVAWVLGA